MARKTRRRKKRHASYRSARSTKGWAKAEPKTREERRKLYKKCGSDAFLYPDKADPGMSKFPIMSKTGSCAVDCRALRIALTRAKQYRYPGVHKKAEKLGSKYACHWAASEE